MKYKNMVCQIQWYGPSLYIRCWMGTATGFAPRHQMREQSLKPVLFKIKRGGKLAIVPRAG